MHTLTTESFQVQKLTFFARVVRTAPFLRRPFCRCPHSTRSAGGIRSRHPAPSRFFRLQHAIALGLISTKDVPARLILLGSESRFLLERDPWDWAYGEILRIVCSTKAINFFAYGTICQKILQNPLLGSFVGIVRTVHTRFQLASFPMPMPKISHRISGSELVLV